MRFCQHFWCKLHGTSTSISVLRSCLTCTTLTISTATLTHRLVMAFACGGMRYKCVDNVLTIAPRDFLLSLSCAMLTQALFDVWGDFLHKFPFKRFSRCSFHVWAIHFTGFPSNSCLDASLCTSFVTLQIRLEQSYVYDNVKITHVPSALPLSNVWHHCQLLLSLCVCDSPFLLRM